VFAHRFVDDLQKDANREKQEKIDKILVEQTGILGMILDIIQSEVAEQNNHKVCPEKNLPKSFLLSAAPLLVQQLPFPHKVTLDEGQRDDKKYPGKNDEQYSVTNGFRHGIEPPKNIHDKSPLCILFLKYVLSLKYIIYFVLSNPSQ
jgi:hypothetical protein